jgi:hypothetical protein
VKLTPELCAKHWAGLSADTDVLAYQSMVAFTSGGADGVKFLGSKLRSSPLAKTRPWSAMLRGLNSAIAEERDQATRELVELAEVAVPRLRGVPAASAILTKVDVFRTSGVNGRVTPTFLAQVESVRAARALVALETLGTADAREVLKALVQDAPQSWLGEEAQTILNRLARRQTGAP